MRYELIIFDWEGTLFDSAWRLFGKLHVTAKNEEASFYFSEVQNLLESLKKQGYLLAVATGKSRRGLDRDLQDLDIGSLFAATVCAEETAAKPNPDMVLDILARFDIPPEKALLVGDSACDLQMAEYAGIKAVGLYHSKLAKEALMTCPALGYIDSLTKLPDFL